MGDWIIRECPAEEAEAVLAMWREAGACQNAIDPGLSFSTSALSARSTDYSVCENAKQIVAFGFDARLPPCDTT